MNELISFKLEEGEFESDFIDNNFYIAIYLDKKEIGSIEGFTDTGHIHIELIDIYEEYQRKGYGTVCINKLKELGKQFNIKYIDGECRGALIKFYKLLGADFNFREPEDEYYFNHRFYIDL